MGLGTSQKVFTKIMKPVLATLRAKGFIRTAYIDDSCLQGSTFDDCKQNIDTKVAFMDSFGLTMHLDKSVLIPTKQIIFLGFILCSETMTVRLSIERLMKCYNVVKFNY